MFEDLKAWSKLEEEEAARILKERDELLEKDAQASKWAVEVLKELETERDLRRKAESRATASLSAFRLRFRSVSARSGPRQPAYWPEHPSRAARPAPSEFWRLLPLQASTSPSGPRTSRESPPHPDMPRPPAPGRQQAARPYLLAAGPLR